ncbi:MAG: sugar phosphate isomerase/epimerase family protein [Armatimonadota bacterium]
MPDLIMHINYFERGYPLSYAFDKAIEHGFDGIEVRGFSRDGLESDDYLDTVEAEIERTNIPNVTMSLNANFMVSDPEKRDEELERWTHVLKRGADMGVETFNAFTGSLAVEGIDPLKFDRNGSGCATADHWNWAVDAYKALGAVADDVGARLAFETHNNYLHDLATPARKLVDMINSPAVGVNLDMGNIVLNDNGEPLEEALDILEGKIYYLHIKNMFLPRGGGFVPVHISDGVIDNRVMFRILMEQGYDGPVGLEAPRQGDRDYFAEQDIAYIKSVCEDLGWE